MSIYALVIEDDQDAGEVMVQMLQSFGLEVDLIDHPHDALFAISTRPPDLLVLDLCLPGMAGPTLLDSIHGMGSKDLPIVAVSAVYPKDHAITQAALAKGAAIFIGKPFTREVMRIAAQKALGRPLPDKAPTTTSPPPPAPAPKPQAEDYASHQHMNGAASTEVDVVSEELEDGESEDLFEFDPTHEGLGGDIANTSWERALADDLQRSAPAEDAAPQPQAAGGEPPTRATGPKAPEPTQDLPPIQAFLSDKNAVLVIERCTENDLWVRCAGAALQLGNSFRAEMTYTSPGQRRPIRFRMLLSVAAYDDTGAVPLAHLKVTEVKPFERWRKLVAQVGPGR